MTNSNKKIAVIGAGLTGLTAAFYLKQKKNSFQVFEKESRIGGVIQTHQKGDFTWESGPSTGSISKPEVMELFEDLKALDVLETAKSVSKNRYILKNNKLHALPSGPVSGFFTPLFSWKDKFGILLEPFRAKGSDPHENLSSFVKRRLGSSILDYAVDPFVSGVYAGSPETIIPRYALPKLYSLEEQYGSFIKGSIHKLKETKTTREKKATKEVFSAKGGLSTLIHKLEEAIGKESIHTHCENLEIRYENNQYIVSSSSTEPQIFDQVIYTASAKNIFEVFPFLNTPPYQDANQILYTAVAEVAVGFSQWEAFPLDGFGALMPSKENRDLLGILFMSSLFEKRAPQSGAMLAVFVGGERRPELLELSDKELQNLVENELKSILKIQNFKPEIFEIQRHFNAIPQYDILTPKRMAAFEAIQNAYPGLFLGGNGVGGIGMADRIKQGKELALNILK